MTVPHALAASGFDRDRGALYLRCSCEWEDVVYPPSLGWLDVALVNQEKDQVDRFRRHVRSEG